MIIEEIAFDQPKFCQYATWSPNAVTFIDNSSASQSPWNVFIDVNNSVYVVDKNNNTLLIWLENHVTPWKTISDGLNSPWAVVTTLDGDIYIDNGYAVHQVDKWTLNATHSVPAMYVNVSCYRLFVDINGSLYCSMPELQQVMKRAYNSDPNTTTIVAGNGMNGSAPNMLYNTQGIFVDTEFNLYVADSGNNRIQFFQYGQLNATTLVGIGAPGTISLNRPLAVVLDADGYLFIVDRDNHRIVRSGPNGFYC